jgi:DNA-binding PadR family transcriptional regulator
MTSRPKTGRRAATLSEAEYAVLGLLAVLGEASGYDLGRWVRDSVDLILAPTNSRIYAVLPGLLKQGYVSKRSVRQERRPDKRLYRLTTTGREVFEAWLNDSAKSQHRDVLLLKLFFGHFGDPRALLAQVERLREEKEAELEDFTRHGTASLEGPDGQFRAMTIACGLALAEATINWADRTTAALAEIIKRSGKE